MSSENEKWKMKKKEYLVKLVKLNGCTKPIGVMEVASIKRAISLYLSVD